MELRVAPNSTHQARLDPFSQTESSLGRSVWDFIRETAQEQAVGLAIIGTPGSGKSTLLQNVALTFAANRQRRYRLPAYTPLLLFLRDHAKVIASENPPTLGSLAQSLFSKREGLPSPPPAWFERQLSSGRCIVLLDGLDEVANERDRVQVSAWVDKQITAYPQSFFIVTSRPQGYRDAPLTRAHVLETQPFGTEQVAIFIRNWYLSNEIARSGNYVDEGVKRRAGAQAHELLEHLRMRPALDVLTRNPLLLTMVAVVHSSRNALPDRRVELYAEICDVLLGHWNAAKGLSSPLTASQLRVVLEPLAAHMMELRVTELRQAEIMKVVRAPLARVGVNAKYAENFLTDLQARSGLVVERENDRWGFAHLTFQEYLAAAHLRTKGGVQNWASMLQDSWRHEVLRLYAAQGDASALLKTCLQDDSIPALALASELLEEAREIEPAIRREAEETLNAAIESPSPERKRLAAEASLTRRIQRMKGIDDRRAIDLQYISCAEYQAFLDDMRLQRRYHQPDHWIAHHHPPGLATTPISGIRAEDAQAFAGWLNSRRAGGGIFRLPTVAEAQEYLPLEGAGLMTWCRDGNIFSLVGPTPTALLDHVLVVPTPSDALTALDLPAPEQLMAEIEKEHRHAGPLERLVTSRGFGLTKYVRLFLVAVQHESGAWRDKTDLLLDMRLVEFLVNTFGVAYICSLDRTLSSPANEEAISAVLSVFGSFWDNTKQASKVMHKYIGKDWSEHLDSLVAAGEKNDFTKVASVVASAKELPSGKIDGTLTLLTMLLGVRQACTPLEVRQAWRQYTHRLATLAIAVGQRLRVEDEVVRRAHCALQVLLARETGVLPEWEGIRLVRERAPMATGSAEG
ncbi:NACHT domain-containing protein [Archangium gephyra]|uniref:NACHT domain-containing protein n=1 Tax=Archangium gephyra TaxID=48 RepID=UPI003B7D95CE